jgi:hypothetical protein
LGDAGSVGRDQNSRLARRIESIAEENGPWRRII